MIATVALAIAAALLIGTYLTWLSGRHDRLGARSEGAWAALDAQLVRRAAAARAVAVDRHDADISAAATAALSAPPDRRAEMENALSRLLRRYDDPTDPTANAPTANSPAPTSASVAQSTEALIELRRAADRLRLARQFHNDAVRDLRALRRRWSARLLRLGHGSPDRGYFDIDDSVLTAPGTPMTADLP